MPKIFKRFFISLWEVLEVVFVAVATVYIIRTYLLQPFLVSGASMEPSFSDGDYLFVDRLTYRFREPERGEVIVFRYPQDEKTFFIKRVIALPGETVSVGSTGVTVTEKSGKEHVLAESYLLTQGEMRGSSAKTLGHDEYFVMGDNRNYSFDSRNWGSLPRRDVIGAVRVRVFPFRAFGAVRAPAY